MTLHTQLSVIALSLSCSLAYAQSPFGPPDRSIGAGGFSKVQAKAALAPEAARKSGVQDMELLLTKESNEFIVLFKNEAPANMAAKASEAQTLAMQQNTFKATRQSVAATFANGELEIVREYKTLPVAVVRTRSRAALVKLLNNPNVVGVAQDRLLSLSLTESLPVIRQPEVAVRGFRGAGTTVAVLDDNTDYRVAQMGCSYVLNPAIRCRVVAAVGLVDGVPYYPESSSHGTNVAGIIAGVAPDANLALLDVAAQINGQGEPMVAMRDVIEGIGWAIENRQKYNIVALNLSAGVPSITSNCSDDGGVMQNVFTMARNANIISVVSAGNEGTPNKVSFPACAAKRAGGVVVGAMYDAQPWAGKNCEGGGGIHNVACYSNGGPDVTIFAPGTRIGIGVEHPIFSGTSQAAPHVAGAIAVLRGSNAAPQDSHDTTIYRLLNTNGSTVIDYRNGLISPRLDLLASINAMFGTRAATTQPAPAPVPVKPAAAAK